MSNYSKKNVNYLGGKLYIASYDPENNSIPTLTTSNRNTVISYIESNYSFQRVAAIRDVGISMSFSDNRITEEADDPDVGEFISIVMPTGVLSGTWLADGDLEAIATMANLTVQNVAGSAVSTQTQPTIASGNWSFNKPIRLGIKTANGQAATIDSLTAGTDGALVEGTDFFVGVDSDGYTIITVIDSATVTTTAQTLVPVASYTPSQTRLLAYNVQSQDIPYLIVKMESAPDSNGDTDLVYMIKANLTGELTKNFADIVRANGLPGSDIAFETAKGGYVIFDSDRIPS